MSNQQQAGSLASLSAAHLTLHLCLPVPAPACASEDFQARTTTRKGTVLGQQWVWLSALSHYPLWEWVVSWGRHAILLPLPLPKPNPLLYFYRCTFYHYHGLLSHGFDKGTFSSDSSQHQQFSSF